MAYFCSLFSGSSGNSSLAGSGDSAVLVDAGMSARRTCLALKEVGKSIEDIRGIFVTHEHSDHIRGLAVLASRYRIPIYANGGTIRGILGAMPDFPADSLHEFVTGETIEAGELCVSSFATSHDSNESVGYRIQTPSGRSVAVATDLGYVSDTVLENIETCDIVMLESNHDVHMLQCGRYPYYLKRRILSDRGHLSNEDCSAVLPSLVKQGTKHIFLAHLSEDNNVPELAVQTAVSALQCSGLEPGRDFCLEAAPRFLRSSFCTV